MKRVFALLLAAAALTLPLFAVYGGADEIDVTAHCVTWLMTNDTQSKAYDGRHYIAKYYRSGEIPVPPEQTPAIQSDAYYYNFVGWEHANAQMVRDFFADPALPYGATFTQSPFEAVSTEEVVYVPRFVKAPKKLNVNDDTYVNIKDVTMLLNYLAGQRVGNYGPGIDANEDGISNILDVTKLINYISTGRE